MRIRHTHFNAVAPLPEEPDLFFIAEQCEPVKWDSGAPSGGEPVSHIVLPEKRVPDFPGGVPSVGIDTSREAAARIRPHTARVREAIYLYIRACGGATAGEIATQCGLNPSTVRPRLLELQGLAKWAPGLPARIQRSPEKRHGMRIYVAG